MNLTGRPKQKYQPNWHDPGQRMRDGGAVGVAWRGDARRWPLERAAHELFSLREAIPKMYMVYDPMGYTTQLSSSEHETSQELKDFKD